MALYTRIEPLKDYKTKIQEFLTSTGGPDASERLQSWDLR